MGITISTVLYSILIWFVMFTVQVLILRWAFRVTVIVKEVQEIKRHLKWVYNLQTMTAREIDDIKVLLASIEQKQAAQPAPE